MHWIDYAIVCFYLLFMLGMGLWFFRRQTTMDEYFVGDRRMGAGHIGLSVVATDVGGGFSIGLGGLGFSLGISGSWLLFTGLLGAWLSAVLLIPKVWELGHRHGLRSYPGYLERRFNGRVRTLAAILSAVGYASFVGSQILAGATLSAAAFNIDLQSAVWIMAVVVVGYTALGGLQAVVYTDTVQWTILLVGLTLAALPAGWVAVGGWSGLQAKLPPGHFDLFAVQASTVATWMLSIVPIWFIGMTLYQRIYASRDVKTAKRAWYFAGLLEWPVMAFVGVALGMMGRAMFPEAQPEMGLPLLIRHVLPVGVVGLVLAAYFAAIMSTADSCLLASVGNLVDDLYLRHVNRDAPERRVLTLTRLLTVIVGLLSVLIALLMPSVLEAILLSYAIMVSGLFAPTLGGLLWSRVSSTAAVSSMVAGAVALIGLKMLPGWNPLADPILVALPISALVLVVVTVLVPACSPPE
jgi:solute:Na+ symporter, SSS family